jgi:hypothetical protein
VHLIGSSRWSRGAYHVRGLICGRHNMRSYGRQCGHGTITCISYKPNQRRRRAFGPNGGDYTILSRPHQCDRGGLDSEKMRMVPHILHMEGGGASVIIPREIRGIELISKSIGTRTSIKCKAPSESHMTLRFHINGDGTSTDHKRVMIEKIKLYSEVIVTAHYGRARPSWCTMPFS